MIARFAVAMVALLAAGSASAETMNPDTARRFVAGKLFAYNCFDGTRGAGRIFADGSVVGTIQVRGGGPMKSVWLPAGTLRVKGGTYCASLPGSVIEPCFNLDRTDDQSFRGSVTGLGFFMYCDFTRRMGVARMSPRRHAPEPAKSESAKSEPAKLEGVTADALGGSR
jgi:hypothetical protein